MTSLLWTTPLEVMLFSDTVLSLAELSPSQGPLPSRPQVVHCQPPSLSPPQGPSAASAVQARLQVEGMFAMLYHDMGPVRLL